MENGIQDLIREISKHEEIKAKLATQQQECQLKFKSKEAILTHHDEEINVLENQLKILESKIFEIKRDVTDTDEKLLLMTSNKQEMQRLVKSTDLKIEDGKKDLQSNKEFLQAETNKCQKIVYNQMEVLETLKNSKNNILHFINSSKH